MRGKSDKKYYIMDLSASVTSIGEYKFDKTETYLKSLVDSECFFKNAKSANKKAKLEKMINDLGFEWDPLSESGHMRQLPYATTMKEAIEKHNWLVVENFCDGLGLPLYRVSGGELFDVNSPEVKKQISLLSKSSGIYGSDQYNVFINKKERILRYNACIQKLSMAKKLNFYDKDLPIALFEISKSYRFEKENELRLCKRTRSFLIPELDVINDSMRSSLKLALSAHAKISDEIQKFDSECELLCSVTQDFFKENFDFLKIIAKSINKPILLAVYQDACCKDGVKIDIEYNVFDSLKLPVEIATCLVDDGSSVFSLDLKFKTKSGIKKPVSMLHVVFPFGSIERSAYFLIDRAIKKEAKDGFGQLPFWVSPIQARILAYDNGSSEVAEKLAQELNSLNFRVDFDDRKINYNAKIKARDLNWIPYMITVDKNINGLRNLIVDQRLKKISGKIMSQDDLIKEMRAEDGGGVTVPRYAPMRLSKRVINNK